MRRNCKLRLVLFGIMMITIFPSLLYAQEMDQFRIARVHYQGGGDWYSSPTALTNLIRYAKERVPIAVDITYDDAQLGSRDIHNYPFLHMSGHGHISVNEAEMENLRSYLENGGFLYVDDDYGFDEYVRPVIERIFPEKSIHIARAIILFITSSTLLKSGLRQTFMSMTGGFHAHSDFLRPAVWYFFTRMNLTPRMAGLTTSTRILITL